MSGPPSPPRSAPTWEAPTPTTASPPEPLLAHDDTLAPEPPYDKGKVAACKERFGVYDRAMKLLLGVERQYGDDGEPEFYLLKLSPAAMKFHRAQHDEYRALGSALYDDGEVADGELVPTDRRTRAAHRRRIGGYRRRRVKGSLSRSRWTWSCSSRRPSWPSGTALKCGAFARWASRPRWSRRRGKSPIGWASRMSGREAESRSLKTGTAWAYRRISYGTIVKGIRSLGTDTDLDARAFALLEEYRYLKRSKSVRGGGIQVWFSPLLVKGGAS